MTQEEINERMERVSRLCAVFLVMAHSLTIVDARIEAEAFLLGKKLTHENKMAFNGIFRAAKQMQFHMDQVSDFALSAARTEDGLEGTPAFMVLQKDASDLLQLVLLWSNASYADDEARIKVESYLKVLAKGKYLIHPDVIESLRTRL